MVNTAQSGERPGEPCGLHEAAAPWWSPEGLHTPPLPTRAVATTSTRPTLGRRVWLMAALSLAAGFAAPALPREHAVESVAPESSMAPPILCPEPPPVAAVTPVCGCPSTVPEVVPEVTVKAPKKRARRAGKRPTDLHESAGRLLREQIRPACAGLVAPGKTMRVKIRHTVNLLQHNVRGASLQGGRGSSVEVCVLRTVQAKVRGGWGTWVGAPYLDIVYTLRGN